MKYAPKKVFIIKDGGYQELTYEAYCALCESDSSYKDKRFLPLHGMLMEVTEDDFKEFYRNQRRQKYLEERSINNQDISIDMLPTQEFRDRDVLFDSDQDVAEKVLNNIFLDKLREVLCWMRKTRNCSGCDMARNFSSRNSVRFMAFPSRRSASGSGNSMTKSKK